MAPDLQCADTVLAVASDLSSHVPPALRPQIPAPTICAVFSEHKRMHAYISPRKILKIIEYPMEGERPRAIVRCPYGAPTQKSQRNKTENLACFKSAFGQRTLHNLIGATSLLPCRGGYVHQPFTSAFLVKSRSREHRASKSALTYCGHWLAF